MVKQCALNQIQGFWLLLDVLQATLTINVKCKLMLIIYNSLAHVGMEIVIYNWRFYIIEWL
jgi:hypothetical protein